VKDPACRVAPERGGPSRKRRPSPSSGTATNTPAHPRRPKISRISLKEHRRAAAEQERHPCTKRRQPDALRAGLWASGRPARRVARVPAGQLRKAAPSRSAKRGKECDPRESRSFSPRSRSSPEGPRLQAWFAWRIERVARRAAPFTVQAHFLRIYRSNHVTWSIYTLTDAIGGV
jgi:hypothetical protein